MTNSWVIGALPGCDLVVDKAGVEGRHCRLTREPDGYRLEDLQSQAGTFVNGVRISAIVRVVPGASITLGRLVEMPWPEGTPMPMPVVLTIGREPDNDVVIDLPIVSGHHARLTWEGRPGQGLLEDLGSSNGTAIGSIDRKITRSVVTASDLIIFGNHPVPASELLVRIDPSIAPPLVFQGSEMVMGRDASCHRVIDRPTISGRHAKLTRMGDRIRIEDLGSSNGTFLNGRPVVGVMEAQIGDLIGLGRDSFRLANPAPVSAVAAPARTQRIEALGPMAPSVPSPTVMVAHHEVLELVDEVPEPASTTVGPPWPVTLLGLLIQAPVVAIVIGLAFGGSPATALFWLGLAAVWFGLSNAIAGVLLDPSRPRGGPNPANSTWWLSRLSILGALCLLQCVMAVPIAFPAAGLKGSSGPAVGLLILASGVGLAIGTIVVLTAPRPAIAWASLGLIVVPLWLFGGGPWSLPRAALPIKVVSNVVPTRWAFEGLLLSEKAETPAKIAANGKTPAENRELAEEYFPARSDRMGPRADAMALGSMMIGLLGVTAFLITLSGSRPG